MIKTSFMLLCLSLLTAAVLLAAPGSDLTVVKVDGVSPSRAPRVGTPIPLLKITLKNKGNAPAKAVTLRVTCKRKHKGIFVDYPKAVTAGWPRQIMPPLKPGEQRVINQKKSPLHRSEKWKEGQYLLIISVDPHNRIAESNERNNKLKIPFTIR